MATPLTAGIAGLVASEHPGYSPVQIKNAVMHGADRPAALRSLVNPLTVRGVHSGKLASGTFTVTNGRVNADAALTASPSNATPKSDGTMAGARRLKRKAHGSVQWPSDPTDVYRSRLKRGTWDILILRKGPSSDLWVFEPGRRTSGSSPAGVSEAAARSRARSSEPRPRRARNSSASRLRSRGRTLRRERLLRRQEHLQTAFGADEALTVWGARTPDGGWKSGAPRADIGRSSDGGATPC